jgi:hypothetical protein
MSNPIRFSDRTGLYLVAGAPTEGSVDFSADDYALIADLISRIRRDACAAEIVDEIERRPNHVVVRPGRFGQGARSVLGWVPDGNTNGPVVFPVCQDTVARGNRVS